MKTLFHALVVLVVVFGFCLSGTTAGEKPVSKKRQQGPPPDWAERFDLPIRVTKGLPHKTHDALLFYTETVGNINSGANVLMTGPMGFVSSGTFEKAKKIAAFNEELMNNYMIMRRTDEEPLWKKTKVLPFKNLSDDEQGEFVRYYSTLVKGLWLSGVAFVSSVRLADDVRRFIDRKENQPGEEAEIVVGEMVRDVQQVHWIIMDAGSKSRHNQKLHETYKRIGKHTLTPLPQKEDILGDPQSILSEYVTNGELIVIVEDQMPARIR